jgi:hypothetical protein
MSILFKHLRSKNSKGEIQSKGGMTIAVEGMSVELFMSAVEQILSGNTFVIKTGMSLCSEQDPFKKETGRNLAVSRLEDVVVQPIGIIRNELMCLVVGTRTILTFALTPRKNVILTQVMQDS